MAIPVSDLTDAYVRSYVHMHEPESRRKCTSIATFQPNIPYSTKYKWQLYLRFWISAFQKYEIPR